MHLALVSFTMFVRLVGRTWKFLCFYMCSCYQQNCFTYLKRSCMSFLHYVSLLPVSFISCAFFSRIHRRIVHHYIRRKRAEPGTVTNLQTRTLISYANFTHVTSASIWKKIAYDLSGWQLGYQVSDPSCPG
jgi:hypothetical protein